MKKLFLICLLVCLTPAAFSQETVIQSHTALTAPSGRLEFGLLNPLTFALTDTLELSTHHVLDVLLPNLALKANWLRRESFYFSTEHELNYPTMLLKTLQVEDAKAGGLLAMDNDIPQIFVLKNSFLATWIFGKQNITSRIGINGALKFPDNDFETIDYPIIFSNTAVYHTYWSINMGAGWRWEITPALNLCVDGDLYLTPLPLDRYEIRQATQLIWSPASWFSLTGGCLLTYGSYPYGKEFKVFPLVDTIFSFGGK